MEVDYRVTFKYISDFPYPDCDVDARDDSGTAPARQVFVKFVDVGRDESLSGVLHVEQRVSRDGGDATAMDVVYRAIRRWLVRAGRWQPAPPSSDGSWRETECMVCYSPLMQRVPQRQPGAPVAAECLVDAVPAEVVRVGKLLVSADDGGPCPIPACGPIVCQRVCHPSPSSSACAAAAATGAAPSQLLYVLVNSLVVRADGGLARGSEPLVVPLRWWPAAALTPSGRELRALLVPRLAAMLDSAGTDADRADTAAHLASLPLCAVARRPAGEVGGMPRHLEITGFIDDGTPAVCAVEESTGGRGAVRVAEVALLFPQLAAADYAVDTRADGPDRVVQVSSCVASADTTVTYRILRTSANAAGHAHTSEGVSCLYLRPLKPSRA